MTHNIERLYSDFVQASDVMVPNHVHVLQLEADICSLLAHERGGTFTANGTTWTLARVAIGKVRLNYFRVTTVRHPESLSDDWRGYSFKRPGIPTDILPTAAPLPAS